MLRSLPLVFAVLSVSTLITFGQTLTFQDSSTTVNVPAANSITFQGAINVNNAGANAVQLGVPAPPPPPMGLPNGVVVVFESGSSTFSGAAGNDAVNIAGDFNGSFRNDGVITSIADEGIDFTQNFSGSFINRGTITGDDSGIDFSSDMAGAFENQGSISGGEQGFDVDGDLTGSFVNSGSITGSDQSGVEIEGRLIGDFTNTGSILGIGEEGVDIFGLVSGNFINHGSIIGEGLDGLFFLRLGNTGVVTNTGTIAGAADGIFTRTLNGQLNNSGSIIGRGSHGLHVRVDLAGTVSNTGTIKGATIGVIVNNDLSGLLFNCGVIEGTSNAGIRTNTTTGTIWNDGGRIQGGNNAITMQAGTSTVILSGPSHIVGNMSAGAGSDILRFQQMRGITAAKEAELVALAAADSPLQTSVTLFGETISWVGFDDIQTDSSTLESYTSLITGPGLQQYAEALDNVTGLNDSFREFLKELNKADASLLNEIVANSSGQTLINGINDFVRNQDTRIYSLLISEFSTLRGNISGGGESSAGQPTGLFTREVPVGGRIEPIDDSTQTYITGYVGRGTQNRSLARQNSSYDNTTILFGTSREVSNEWQMGFFGGYTDNESATDRFGSLLKNEAAYFGVNAQYTSDYFFANLVAAYGFHDQASVRRDFIGNSMRGNATGHQGFLYTQIGRDLYLGEEDRLKVSPYAGFTLSSVLMGDFTESGNPGTNLRFADETTTSVQTVLGINASCYKDTSYGWIRPRIDAAWWHEYTGADSYGVSLASPGLLNGFDIFSQGTNRNRGVFQIGTSIGFNGWESTSFDLSYFGATGEDGLSAHGGAFSATFEF